MTDYVARMPLKNLENPQVYSIIPDELMAEQLTTDIQGAVKNAPGVNNVVEGVGSGGVGLNVNLRGFSTGIAMRNGMATNFVTLSDPVNLKRIEVIKGPSATLFGSTLISYGGLINRVTEKPLKTFQGSVGYSTGSFGLSRLTADINTPLNNEKTVLFRINAAKHDQRTYEDHQKIDEAIRFLSMEDIKDSYLDELSGGQKQRAYLAMVVAQDTDYILLDEPLNNLDMKYSVQIMKTLRRLADELGKTIIIVLHDINFASHYSDYIATLKDGNVKYYGITNEIITEQILQDVFDVRCAITEKNGKKTCNYFNYNS